MAQSQGGQAVNHIGDINKMVSDTPISDSTAHNVAELGMLCRRLERKLAATRKYLSQVTERAKKLEEAGDAMINEEYNKPRHVEQWRKVKEAKP
jgi:hypothetical protein